MRTHPTWESFDLYCSLPCGLYHNAMLGLLSPYLASESPASGACVGFLPLESTTKHMTQVLVAAIEQAKREAL